LLYWLGLGIAPFTSYKTEVISLTPNTQNFVIDFTMNNATTNVGSLEFYLGGISGDVILDNITFIEVPCIQDCTPTLNLNGVVSNLLYEAGNRINSNADVSPNSDVHFHAGNRIELESNFSVPANAIFRAAIEPCGTSPD